MAAIRVGPAGGYNRTPCDRDGDGRCLGPAWCNRDKSASAKHRAIGQRRAYGDPGSYAHADTQANRYPYADANPGANSDNRDLHAIAVTGEALRQERITVVDHSYLERP